MRRHIRWTSAVLFATVATVAHGVCAKAADEERGPRAEARATAQKGDVEFSKGRCDRAIALWRKADATFHAPTILLRIARCQALMGRVVAAADALEAIAAEQLPSDAPVAF